MRLCILLCDPHSTGKVEVFVADLVQASHLNGSSGMPNLDGCKLPAYLLCFSVITCDTLRHGVLEQYDAHAGRWQVKLLATSELKAIHRRVREMKDFSKIHRAESLGSWEALLAKD